MNNECRMCIFDSVNTNAESDIKRPALTKLVKCMALHSFIYPLKASLPCNSGYSLVVNVIQYEPM